MTTTAGTPAHRSAIGGTGRRIPEWAVGVGVGVIVIVVMTIPFLQHHQFYYRGDNPESFIPLWHHFGQQLRAGHWPTMEPSGWAGGNYAGEGTYALWNPVQLFAYVIVSLFDDLATAAAVVQIGFLGLLGTAVYLLSREYEARRIPAVAVAVGVPATGFTMYYEAAGWPAGLMAFTWVIWFWWAARRQARGHLWPFVPFLVGALGMTTGNPYAALGIVVVLSGIAVELFVRRAYRLLGGLVLTGACVGAVAALVFLPMAGTLPVTDRPQTAMLSNDMFLVPHLSDMLLSSAPTYLPGIVNWNGAVLEQLPSTYFLWFAMPVLPWLRWRGLRRTHRPLTSLVLITAVYGALSLGPSNVWLFRWPIRLIEYFYVGVAVLLALVLSRGFARDHVRERLLATVGIVAAGAYLSFALRPDLYRMHVMAGLGVLSLVLAAVYASCRRGPFAGGALLVVGTAVVVTYQTSRLPVGIGSTTATGGQPPSSIAQVRDATSFYRGPVLQLSAVTSLGVASRTQTGELLFGNEGLMSGHESLVRYSGMGFQDFTRALCMDYRGQFCPEAFDRVWAPDEETGVPLIDLLRVQTLVLDARMFPGPVAGPPPGGWSVVARDDLRTVWVRNRPSTYEGRLSWASPGIDIRSDRSRAEVESVSFRAIDDGTLTFARLNWPGYSATLDGEPIAVRTGSAGLLRVDVPAGRHVLTLRFESPGSSLGVGLLAVAVPVSLGQTVLWITTADRRRQRIPASSADRSGPAVGTEHVDVVPIPTGATGR
ncbi:hypothetical protein GCM10027451_29960 [Geodermatophilus aquaeductus]|uniref:Membrane protein YfhO n=1 Tax=Geodermatophilus aquaeductus TaxID=1564161 RepID=A0A521FUM8_9ACTN|nr:hypothetical protein [Geodermatophilus aquaeductus]SMO99804.1 hypothetical protein SAMN06273567_11928 [Geodermatophilus aquaeductus]